jgi:cephalosporin hydroxylase
MIGRAWQAVRWRLDRAAVAGSRSVLRRYGVWNRTYWLGTKALKNPLDLWVFQEIIQETHPDVIVETGTFDGGSALYLATVCDARGVGEVISIDIEQVREDYPSHRRVTYMGGRSSTDPEVVATVRERVSGRRAMVILDSDHRVDHVAAELEAYGPLVGEGCYLIVEDTDSAEVKPQLAPGPPPAIEAFLACNPEFEIDRTREKFMFTSNAGGYLRRRA